ncbi:Bbp1p NDAI_0F01160 [Naumovozyma dairenensis CBS 421]|uniref:Spindle pole component BBP1 n=1 Tax=Naumovozyma dairenensis (strain ATCC 10597 / BCRC 20456 / CBS 421 / NBRC 0211 / NRRL Y-12639) TaxID=1071378 RepID=G0WCC4_NAUDC|nr:hypothetical protein NDAI_0F01160 [Naumovozyma dairenensis CBS 421]CCD25435.1 hypothetical protein NDAI_0F01160 [Naumovozyma dairenensis CBS 421]
MNYRDQLLLQEEEQELHQPDNSPGNSGLFKWTIDALFGPKKEPHMLSQDDTNYNNMNHHRRMNKTRESPLTELKTRSNSWDGSSLSNLGLDSSFYRKYDLLSPSNNMQLQQQEQQQQRYNHNTKYNDIRNSLMSPIHLRPSMVTNEQQKNENSLLRHQLYNHDEDPPNSEPTDTFQWRNNRSKISSNNNNHRQDMDNDIPFRPPKDNDTLLSKLFGKGKRISKSQAENKNDYNNNKTNIPGKFPSPAKSILSTTINEDLTYNNGKGTATTNAPRKPHNYVKEYQELLDEICLNTRSLHLIDKDLQERDQFVQLQEEAFQDKYNSLRLEFISQLKQMKKLSDKYFKLLSKYQTLKKISLDAENSNDEQINDLQGQLTHLKKSIQFANDERRNLTRDNDLLSDRLRDSEIQRENDQFKYESKIRDLERQLLEVRTRIPEQDHYYYNNYSNNYNDTLDTSISSPAMSTRRRNKFNMEDLGTGTENRQSIEDILTMDTDELKSYI